MTDEQMRIAIAEACGWKPYKPITHDGWPLLMTPPKKPNKEGWLETIPDYLNDLNACAEFEKTLTDDELWEYSKLLMDYRQAANGFPLASRSEVLKLQKATVRQRAEAFLKTLNLWKD